MLASTIYKKENKNEYKRVRFRKYFILCAGIKLKQHTFQSVSDTLQVLHPQTTPSRKKMWESFCFGARMSVFMFSLNETSPLNENFTVALFSLPCLFLKSN